MPLDNDPSLPPEAAELKDWDTPTFLELELSVAEAAFGGAGADGGAYS